MGIAESRSTASRFAFLRHKHQVFGCCAINHSSLPGLNKGKLSWTPESLQGLVTACQSEEAMPCDFMWRPSSEPLEWNFHETSINYCRKRVLTIRMLVLAFCSDIYLANMIIGPSALLPLPCLQLLSFTEVSSSAQKSTRSRFID